MIDIISLLKVHLDSRKDLDGVDRYLLAAALKELLRLCPETSKR